jgi:hypothetical protein
MEQFFKSLSKRELGAWIKQFTSYELLNQFLNNAQSKKNDINLIGVKKNDTLYRRK